MGIVFFYTFIGFVRSIETDIAPCADWQEALRDEPFAIISGALVAAAI